MAKITARQFARWDKANLNGWHFDLQHYQGFAEKQIHKLVNIVEPTTYLIAELRYHENYNGHTFKLMSVQPELSLELVEKRTNGMYVVSSIAFMKKILLGEPMAKKSYALLQKFTAEYDDAKLLEIYKEHTKEVNRVKPRRNR